MNNMQDVTVIILGGGSSSRFNQKVNKIYMPLLGKSVIMHSIDKFKALGIENIIVVYNKFDEAMIKALDLDLVTIEGGASRALSLNNALPLVKTNKILVHDAARPWTNPLDIKALINALDDADVVTLYHYSVDAIKVHGSHLKKDDVYLVTTPQGFKKSSIELLLNANINREDDLEPFEQTNAKISYILETSPNKKITYISDLISSEYKVGHSFDFHPLAPNRKLILGGIEIASTVGLLGHSDADVLLHAISEALLGALNQGDLGDNFPDASDKYKDISSTYFLKNVKERLDKKNYSICNIDCMIYLEKPKLEDLKLKMAKNIAEILNIDQSKISIKATTLEKQGAIGLSEGIAASAYVLIKNNNE